jgi:hypothetical protein
MTTPTKLVEQAFAVIRQLPPETQDDIARMLLALVDGEPALTMDDAAAVAEAEVEIGRGERVPNEIVQAFWRAHLATR